MFTYHLVCSPAPVCDLSHPILLSVFQDPFRAFHLDKALVRKYMNSLLIGELALEQPSFEPSKNVSVVKDGCWDGLRQQWGCADIAHLLATRTSSKW